MKLTRQYYDALVPKEPLASASVQRPAPERLHPARPRVLQLRDGWLHGRRRLEQARPARGDPRTGETSARGGPGADRYLPGVRCQRHPGDGTKRLPLAFPAQDCRLILRCDQ